MSEQHDEDTKAVSQIARRAVEQLPCRGTLPFEVISAGMEEGVYRVRGRMSSFKLMHSGRILHPQGFVKWLNRTKNPRLPILAQHGFIGGGFATIGEWDEFKYKPGEGMIWSGRIGEATELTDQARQLLDQKLLRQLSLGWVSKQARWVKADDDDLDPHFKQALEEAEEVEAYAYIDWYPVEGSLVDVADDPGARLAAEFQQELIQPVQKQIADLAAAVGALKGAETKRIATLTDEQFERLEQRLAAEFQQELIQPVQKQIADLAAAVGALKGAETKRIATLTDEQFERLEQRLAEVFESYVANVADLAAAYLADELGGDADDADESDPADGPHSAPCKPRQSAPELPVAESWQRLIERIRRVRPP